MKGLLFQIQADTSNFWTANWYYLVLNVAN